MIVLMCHDNRRSWGAIDSTDEHKDVLDEVTVMKVRWRVKGSATPDGDTEVIQYK